MFSCFAKRFHAHVPFAGYNRCIGRDTLFQDDFFGANIAIDSNKTTQNTDVNVCVCLHPPPYRGIIGMENDSLI